MTDTPFRAFPKIARFNREVIVTEKIDGTHASIHVAEDGTLTAGSRNQWITPAADNFGFARWVADHADSLRALGPGQHFGEWWGAGIQRRYGLTEKRFSLFNVSRWESEDRPSCCHVVPVLWRGLFADLDIRGVLADLQRTGSHAAPRFMQPEGVVVVHLAGGVGFKMTILKDEYPKGPRQ